jgi:hypothetical protein
MLVRLTLLLHRALCCATMNVRGTIWDGMLLYLCMKLAFACTSLLEKSCLQTISAHILLGLEQGVLLPLLA